MSPSRSRRVGTFKSRAWRAGWLRTPPAVCVLGPAARGMLIATRIGARLPVLVFDARRGRSRARGIHGHAAVLQVASLVKQLVGADIYVIATDRDQFDNAIDTVSLVLAPGAIVVFATHALMRRRDGRAVHSIEAVAGMLCNYDFYVAHCTARGRFLHAVRGAPIVVARYLQRLQGMTGASRSHNP